MRWRWPACCDHRCSASPMKRSCCLLQRQRSALRRCAANAAGELAASSTNFARIRNCVSPDQLLRRVLDDCDYESGLTSRGRANVEKFMAALRSRHASAARLARRRPGLHPRRFARRGSASCRLRRRRAPDDDSQVEGSRVSRSSSCRSFIAIEARALRSSATPISMGSV